MTKDDRKKARERWLLENARKLSSVFPDGDLENFEEPDFKINCADNRVCIEVTELIRKGDDGEPRPVAAADFHKQVVRKAEEIYRQRGGGTRHVSCTFLEEERARIEKRVEWTALTANGAAAKKTMMAETLTEFVAAHADDFYSDRQHLPAGFELIALNPCDSHIWNVLESATLTLHDMVYFDIAGCIENKADKLVRYRENCPGSQIWLLVASSLEVPRGVPIPRAVAECRFPFEFDKVLLYSAMDGKVWELARSKPGDPDRE